MISSFTYDGSIASRTRYLTISASVMVSLNANDIFDLELNPVDETPVAVESASINITQIA
ncbi:MAG: hypothetical protein K0U24_00600 [Gammaproteobacteria bacterium]|nr:hypothetical protein [Gammaproteobacteria bacterium]MCH9717971.1 hypothetical protein [Gammaproteobacteria bacterium]MCH9762726.1 hypothetical protein [Gammaproteobacteria bacterium]